MIFKAKTKAREQGDLAESQAKNYLQDQGLLFIAQGYSCKLGEIDLIMDHDGTLTFIEVRYRKSNAFGGAAASISAAKQARIINTAKHYLAANRLYDKRPVRFDVLACSNIEMQWIQGAF